MPSSQKEPWGKLTVGSELIKFPTDLPLKFYTRTAWYQSPTRTCFYAYRWFSCKPQKIRPSSFPQCLKNNPKTVSDRPRWGVNTEEPALLRTEKQTLFKCLDLQEISDNLLMFVWILFQDAFVVQLLNHSWLFATPWTAAHQASLSLAISQNLLKLMSIELVMPSNHLILCCLLLLPPSNFPSIRVFSNESTLLIRWPKYFQDEWKKSYLDRNFLKQLKPSIREIIPWFGWRH